MNKKIIFIITMLFVSVCIFSQEATPEPVCESITFRASGYILDAETGDPVYQASITVVGTSGSRTVKNLSDGYYLLFVPNCMTGDIATFTVTMEGYDDYVISTSVVEATTINFLLTYSGEPSPTPDPNPTATPVPAVTCQPALSNSYGYITDAETNEPIIGATIFVEASIGNSETTSDSEGYYSLYISTCMMGESAVFTVTVEGYEELVTTRGSNTNNDFALTPSSITNPTPGPTPIVPGCPPVVYVAQGFITDIITDIPISGAAISVEGTQGSASTTTGSDGFYEFYVPNCNNDETATFTVTAAGYYTETATRIISLSNIIDFALMPQCTLGDVNVDGAIDIVDALLLAQYYVGIQTGIDNICAADVNCDGTIDIIDALLIAQYYVGLIPSFPC
ncbi:MAG: carboxypeptidase regulatory-like domain-containing protein [Spirochaetales bacterium]|nr:carboxypeptidase regulatory-like domain-containing protein [Spirochaetales bacterium]